MNSTGESFFNYKDFEFAEKSITSREKQQFSKNKLEVECLRTDVETPGLVKGVVKLFIKDKLIAGKIKLKVDTRFEMRIRKNRRSVTIDEIIDKIRYRNRKTRTKVLKDNFWVGVRNQRERAPFLRDENGVVLRSKSFNLKGFSRPEGGRGILGMKEAGRVKSGRKGEIGVIGRQSSRNGAEGKWRECREVKRGPDPDFLRTRQSADPRSSFRDLNSREDDLEKISLEGLEREENKMSPMGAWRLSNGHLKPGNNYEMDGEYTSFSALPQPKERLNKIPEEAPGNREAIERNLSNPQAIQPTLGQKGDQFEEEEDRNPSPSYKKKKTTFLERMLKVKGKPLQRVTLGIKNSTKRLRQKLVLRFPHQVTKAPKGNKNQTNQPNPFKTTKNQSGPENEPISKNARSKRKLFQKRLEKIKGQPRGSLRLTSSHLESPRFVTEDKSSEDHFSLSRTSKSQKTHNEPSIGSPEFNPHLKKHKSLHHSALNFPHLSAKLEKSFDGKTAPKEVIDLDKELFESFSITISTKEIDLFTINEDITQTTVLSLPFELKFPKNHPQSINLELSSKKGQNEFLRYLAFPELEKASFLEYVRLKHQLIVSFRADGRYKGDEGMLEISNVSFSKKYDQLSQLNIRVFKSRFRPVCGQIGPGGKGSQESTDGSKGSQEEPAGVVRVQGSLVGGWNGEENVSFLYKENKDCWSCFRRLLGLDGSRLNQVVPSAETPVPRNNEILVKRSICINVPKTVFYGKKEKVEAVLQVPESITTQYDSMEVILVRKMILKNNNKFLNLGSIKNGLRADSVILGVENAKTSSKEPRGSLGYSTSLENQNRLKNEEIAKFGLVEHSMVMRDTEYNSNVSRSGLEGPRTSMKDNIFLDKNSNRNSIAANSSQRLSLNDPKMIRSTSSASMIDSVFKKKVKFDIVELSEIKEEFIEQNKKATQNQAKDGQFTLLKFLKTVAIGKNWAKKAKDKLKLKTQNSKIMSNLSRLKTFFNHNYTIIDGIEHREQILLQKVEKNFQLKNEKIRSYDVCFKVEDIEHRLHSVETELISIQYSLMIFLNKGHKKFEKKVAEVPLTFYTAIEDGNQRAGSPSPSKICPKCQNPKFGKKPYSEGIGVVSQPSLAFSELKRMPLYQIIEKKRQNEESLKSKFLSINSKKDSVGDPQIHQGVPQKLESLLFPSSKKRVKRYGNIYKNSKSEGVLNLGKLGLRYCRDCDQQSDNLNMERIIKTLDKAYSAFHLTLPYTRVDLN